MILVDSSVWIDFFNGVITPESDYLDSILGKENILVGDIILVEVLQGFKSENNFNTARKLLDEFPYRNMLGTDIALQCAKYYRHLCKKGITTRKTIDLIIATFCIENNIQLLFTDKDFDLLVKHLHLRNAYRK